MVDISLAESYPYSMADHIPCENSSGKLENPERPLMVRMMLCNTFQARLFSGHVVTHVQTPARSSELTSSQKKCLNNWCQDFFELHSRIFEDSFFDTFCCRCSFRINNPNMFLTTQRGLDNWCQSFPPLPGPRFD